MKMSEKHRVAFTEILKIMDIIYLELSKAGMDPKSYRGFNKVVRIVKNNSIGGVKNIPMHINSEARMIFDHQIDTSILMDSMELICSLAKELID